MGKLSGKTIVVAGATGDIGGELAISLLAEGALVIGVGRNADKLAALEEKGIHARLTDCSDPVDVLLMLQATYQKFGKPDALITSVGTWREMRVDSEVSKFSSQLTIDLDSIVKAAIIPIFAFNQFFSNRGGGFMADITSHAAEGPLPGNLTYATGKAAVKMFIDNLREENDPEEKLREGISSGIRITRIIAQLVDTPKNRLDPRGKDLTDEDWQGAVQIRNIARFISNNIDNVNAPPEQFFESKIIFP